ncbi:Putative 2-pyrone-4,6-dicarboxylic acid hydrolase [Rubrivivax sp. A210]|uniref:amidohydrolase family protein n=1 Tax=Rubrivivax sp. A210 TaxID=2772301 RepID=UPI00191858DC|nr:amidohydrolase family protein [Rubrivivax sp. A210]CAD5372958.1 Putative 2-pyrone-4,6-dicarboxylic acid hydrolase [Rubrivivax sp. A210]
MPANDSSAAGWDCHVHVFDAAAPVRPGHYLPAHRPLGEIEALAQHHGVGHLVLVQPSVYGSDNAVMLRALEAAAGRHRGVAVVDTDISDAELDRLHAAGVRGARFNLVSPAGHSGDVAADLAALAPRLRERGWHVQWYVQADALPRLVAWQAETGLRFVLDHLAGLGTAQADDAPAWAAARALAAGGAWIKLSGWYRLGATHPYAALQPHVQRVAAMFGPRMVWGSDWPHTGIAPAQLPGYGATQAPVLAALGEAGFDAVLSDQARALYGG